MQPKVSMVMPCYNKEAYIGNMFDSILAQRWDNIELVLVNDGSTDGTRRIIAEYEAKFRVRGFDVIIVDQENRGLPGAVYSGLRLITGDYVCQVDADDELHPEYVSAMAGWLEEHPDYDWAACDILFNDSTYWSYFLVPAKMRDVRANLIEHYIFGRICTSACLYMVRREYLIRCGDINNYFCELRHTQEPQFVFPLALGGGKLKHISKPLYRYRINESSVTKLHRSLEDYIEFYKLFYGTIEETLKRLPLDRAKLNRLITIARISYYKTILLNGAVLKRQDYLQESGWFSEAIQYINTVFQPSPGFVEADLLWPLSIFTPIEDYFFPVPQSDIAVPSGRIIAWGALGRRGKVIVPYLRGTKLAPTELWDIAGDGAAVMKPDVKSLTENDLVLILPLAENGKEIWEEIKGTGCSAILSKEISALVCRCRFPQFYDGSFKFIQEGE